MKEQEALTETRIRNIDDARIEIQALVEGLVATLPPDSAKRIRSVAFKYLGKIDLSGIAILPDDFEQAKAE